MGILSWVAILKPPGKVEACIRDYVYDQTGPGGPYENTPGLVEATIYRDVTAIRALAGQGVVTRSLKKLVDAGLIMRDDKYRPPMFYWNPGQSQPSDYMPRPVPKGPPVTSPTAPAPAVPDDEDAKREELKKELEGRMDIIKGKKKAKEEDEKIPEPKRNARRGISRPNGDEYRMRDLAGHPDVEWLRRLRVRGLYPLLSGPPGTGKTALLEAAFWQENGGLHVITADENTNVEDFMGSWHPTGNPANPYVWVDGPLVLAMREGSVLFIDDATLANPKVLACVYPAMDGRGEVVVKGHVVDGILARQTAASGFFVVAAHNPGVHGAILTDALASRFRTQIWVESDLELAATLGVNPKFLQLVKKLQAERDDNKQISMWIPQLRELLTARDLAKEFNEEVAAANMINVCPEEDQDILIDKLRIVFNKDIKKLELGKQL